jgi:eukaryotic-like serine/threonine-protein kinase
MPSSPFPPDVLAATFPKLSGFGFIKSGSFKSVYRIMTLDGSTEVLKVIRLPQDVSTDAARALREQELGRVKRETELLGRASSPFIVRMGHLAPVILDIKGESCLAYTEEFLPGKDLENEIVGSPQPTGDGIKLLLSSLVEAIRHLWTNYKTVHRDIKPANIFMTGLAERPFVLLDLGIAYNVSEPGLTVDPSHIPATPLYMAPEMLNPDFRDSLSYRADLYAAGVTAFEYATGGTHPLGKRGDDLVKTLSRVLHQEPLRLATLRPDLPPLLTSMIDQLMKKNPALRPGNMSLILNQLR